MAKKLPPGKPFTKGCKPGPGRPKGSGFDVRCKAWAEKYGIPFLERVAQGKEKDVGQFGRPVKVSLSLRIGVTQYLVNRGMGCPRQAVDVTSGGESVADFIRQGVGGALPAKDSK